MADIDYPVTLPSPMGGTFEEGDIPSWVEDRGEVGAPDRRNRFTRSLSSFSYTLRMTHTQKEMLNQFYAVDLVRGVKQFNWTHPTTGETYDVQFASKPRPRHLTADLWEVDVSLQEV